MKTNNVERLIYIVVILLAFLALALVAMSGNFSAGNKVVYQGF